MDRVVAVAAVVVLVELWRHAIERDRRLWHANRAATDRATDASAAVVVVDSVSLVAAVAAVALMHCSRHLR